MNALAARLFCRWAAGPELTFLDPGDLLPEAFRALFPSCPSTAHLQPPACCQPRGPTWPHNLLLVFLWTKWAALLIADYQNSTHFREDLPLHCFTVFFFLSHYKLFTKCLFSLIQACKHYSMSWYKILHLSCLLNYWLGIHNIPNTVMYSKACPVWILT